MKYLFILLVFAFNNCQSQENKKELTYTIKKSIIEHIDENNFEITLNKEGVHLLSKVDFSKFSYIMFESYSTKILLLPSTMSFRPHDVFVYFENKTIIRSNKILLQTKHLDKENSNLKDLKIVLEKINFPR